MIIERFDRTIDLSDNYDGTLIPKTSIVIQNVIWFGDGTIKCLFQD